jgi:hypothetical protein
VIDLRDRDLVIAAPGLTAVECDGRTLIETKEETLIVGRVEPCNVRILTAGSALECAKRFATVGRSIDVVAIV